jgi:endonuclease/exonuclease/phosphatase (EEP) superfamily protein YafD
VEALGLGALLLGAACVVATLLPLSRSRYWWVRIWDFPRLQVAVVALAALAGMVWAGPAGQVGWLLAGATGLAAAYQIAVVLPYTPLWPVQSVRGVGGDGLGLGTLRLVVVNVLMTNRTVDGLFDAVREADPDVVLAMETDAWWVGRLREALAESHPHAIEQSQDNTYGFALRSRLPLVEPEVRRLLHEAIPSARTGIRLRSGAVVRFYAVHPEPPSPTEAESSLGRDAELVMIGREIAMRTGPTVVAGDLNDVAWSRTSRLFRRLSRLLDPRVGRGLFATFHAGWWPVRWPLDHVFHSEDFLLREVRRLPAFGSDHFPILIALEHAPATGAAAQEAVGADALDEAEARETIEEARKAAARGELAPARGEVGAA